MSRKGGKSYPTPKDTEPPKPPAAASPSTDAAEVVKGLRAEAAYYWSSAGDKIFGCSRDQGDLVNVMVNAASLLESIARERDGLQDTSRLYEYWKTEQRKRDAAEAKLARYEEVVKAAREVAVSGMSACMVGDFDTQEQYNVERAARADIGHLALALETLDHQEDR